MSDPVAEKSTFLCMYMSNHPDTLVAYVKYWGKVKQHVVSAKMTSIDSKGMTLSYNVKDSKQLQDVRVAFDPPLAGYEEVKPRLLAMTADAQESLGMTKVPQITSFELPLGVLQTAIPLAFLIYTIISPLYDGPQWILGQYLHGAVGGTTVKWIAIGAAVLHALETIYVIRLCAKHRTSFGVGFQYILGTALFGITILAPLRRKIQKARIDSIMKGN